MHQPQSPYGAPPPAQPGYPPSAYGPPHGYMPPQQFGAHAGYAPAPQPLPAPKKRSSLRTFLIAGGALFVVCNIIGALGSSSAKKTAAAGAAAAVTADPAAAAARAAADAQSAKAAADAKEKEAVDTFPSAKAGLLTAVAKLKAEVDAKKWAQASVDQGEVEAGLSRFRGTSIESDKDFQNLDAKLAVQKQRIAPQLEKLAHAAAAAAAEKELKSNSIEVSSTRLFNDYQANEVAADNRYKGQKLLVTGTVASIDKGLFGSMVLRLSTPNEFMSTMCSMESSEASSLSQISKGEQVRVLCEGSGMTIGSPSLRDCTFR